MEQRDPFAVRTKTCKEGIIRTMICCGAYDLPEDINIHQGLILSLSTIETSFATHATQAITRWDHPDYPALRLTCNVLDGVESYLWVCDSYPGILFKLTDISSSETFEGQVWLMALA
jgi:hypothetical protein